MGSIEAFSGSPCLITFLITFSSHIFPEKDHFFLPVSPLGFPGKALPTVLMKNCQFPPFSSKICMHCNPASKMDTSLQYTLIVGCGTMIFAWECSFVSMNYLKILSKWTYFRKMIFVDSSQLSYSLFVFKRWLVIDINAVNILWPKNTGKQSLKLSNIAMNQNRKSKCDIFLYGCLLKDFIFMLSTLKMHNK